MSSSLEVLIGRDWAASGIALLDETSPVMPDWIYPVTKVMIEDLGSYYAKHHGLEVVQLRYCGVPAVPWEQQGLSLLARQIHCDDAGRSNILSATVPGLTDEFFCIGPQSPLTLADALQAVNESPEPVLERYWPGAVSFLKEKQMPIRKQSFWPLIRIDKAKAVLGWTPQVTFDTWLAHHGWVAPAQ